MKHKLILFVFFACGGITTEVFFTAIRQFFDGTGDLRMTGHSYIWMFPLYGIAALLFPPAIHKMKQLNLILRASIYATGIFLVEFIAGAALEFITGVCPWKYSGGMHVLGYIRLDYFPFWAIFGFVIENIIFGYEKLFGVRV
ncbi:MAG: hypothetical protein KDC13_05590 [Bacteroidetes bacterium]|nr:hypothetical protein [Bacteroidota bacterium]